MTNINLASLTSAQGFSIKTYEYSYYWDSATGIGDINGDGYDDVIISAPNAEGGPDYIVGTSYVLFGKAVGLDCISLRNIAINEGFTISSNNARGRSDHLVGRAGDINHDGFDDVIVGTPYGNDGKAIIYIIFGRAMHSNVVLENLTVNQGIMIYGDDDYLHFSVSEAGDVNGDGYKDIIIGSPGANNFSGTTYIIFGNKTLTNINLANLNFNQGFKIIGEAAGDITGFQVSSAGDVNGDGYHDIAIGSPGVNNFSGTTYIIFGNKTLTNINLANLNFNQGFSVLGVNDRDQSGSAVSGGYDINGDGYDDIIIGANGANDWIGGIYIIFGKPSFFSNIELSNLTIDQGFSITGGKNYQNLGEEWLVSGAGDINNDGIDDIIVSSINSDDYTGIIYLIFGQASNFTNIDISNIKINQGFSISRENDNTEAYYAVSSAGDVNKDGFDDIIISEITDSDVEGYNNRYIIYGKTKFSNNVDLANISSSQGIVIKSITYKWYNYEDPQISIGGNGDINNDGYDDLIVRYFNNGNDTSYVIWGKGNNSFTDIDMFYGISANQGFAIVSIEKSVSYYLTQDLSVRIAGDINGDGYDDIIVGMTYVNSYKGKCYVVYGKNNAENIDLDTITQDKGFVIYGSSDYTGNAINGAGDFNGDGYDDIIIGAPNAYGNDYYSGISYIIFGGNNLIDIKLSSLTLPQGIIINGISKNDRSGSSVSDAGDVNGDGYDDIIIGALSANQGNGASYIIFGNNNPTNINLITLTITQGIVINGSGKYYSGTSLSKAGDINGDGFNDVIIGAPKCYNNCEGRDTDAKSYIIFGGSDMNNIDLANLNTNEGIILKGSSSALGISVSDVGDFNKDGYSDVIIGAINANSDYSSSCYIIYGNSTLENIDINNLSSQKGISISGYVYGQSVGSAGDLNGDGYSDVFALSIYKNYVDNSQAYVIYGGKSGFDASTFDPTISPTYVDNAIPTIFTSADPTLVPSIVPTIKLTVAPATSPSPLLTNAPTLESTKISSVIPTKIPTILSTIAPTSQTIFSTLSPSATPSNIPTISPSTEPSFKPTVLPTYEPTTVPTFSPTTKPTCAPTINPSREPTLKPASPSFFPTTKTTAPTLQPTKQPTFKPTTKPTKMPTNLPSSPTYSPTFPPNMKTSINLENLTPEEGFALKNGNYAVNAGDFNGDSYDDIITKVNSDVVVLFGKGSDFANVNLTNLTYDQGIYLSGAGSVSAINGIGDINGDGYDDIAIGNGYRLYNGISYSGIVYVVYGSSNTDSIFLPDITNSQGFYITNSKYDDSSKYSDAFGSSISSAGDINKDGYGDIIIGAHGAATYTYGNVYIIYGKSSIFNNFDVVNMTISSGIVISGGYIFGYSVSKIGDFNGDGYDDIVVGSPYGSGAVFIIFGGTSLTNLDTSTLYTTQGIKILPQHTQGLLGLAVSGAGDVNNDGYFDVIISAPDATVSDKKEIGVTYIIFGGQNTDINLSNLLSSQGFTIFGAKNYDHSGYSVSGIGDINRDGYSDVIIGMYHFSFTGYYPNFVVYYGKGTSYVIYGKASGFSSLYLSNVATYQGFSLTDNGNYTGYSVSGHGDINGDGCSDIIIGNPSYVMFGCSSDYMTISPVLTPTKIPTTLPSKTPSKAPSITPTELPSSIPSMMITPNFTFIPTFLVETEISDKIYATFSREVYADSTHTPVLEEANGNGNRIPTGWQVLIDSESAGISPNLGEEILGWNFFSKAYRNSDHTAVIIAFQGTESLYDIISEDLDLARGFIPSYYNMVIKFVDYVIDNFNINKNMISFTGHSLGGFLAQLATATYKKPSVIFESPGAKRVIDNYYNHPDYSIKYRSEDIKDIIKCYNAAPNLINIASGAHFEDSVVRLFPVYDTSASTFTLQQHGMSEILQQFSNDGAPKISANMDNYWYFSGSYKNWPYFEANSLSDSLAADSFLNSVFFQDYNQNPYYWELAWDNSPNIDSVLFPSTAKRIASINNAKGGIASGNALSAQGITINGNDNGNKFFGGTNYADLMIGGAGNDEYWPFSGMNKITDTGGSNNYYFYTHNMKGTTVISDMDKTGVIQFVNIGCSITETYQIDFGTNIDGYVFFPQFSSEIRPSSLCDLTKYSSGIRDKLDPTLNQYINHKNDVVLLYSDYPNDADLLISYNNNDRDTSLNNKIVIQNFQEGDFEINLGNDADQETYVAVGSNGNDLFSCSIEQNSILAGLGGINKYIITLFNDKSCSIISNDMDSNIYKVFAEETSRFLKSDYSKTKAINTGIINTFGLKNTDVIDLSSVGLSSFADLSFTFFGNDTVITLPGGMTMRLDATQTFVATTDGTDLALYNSTNHSYTTDLVEAGINITSIYHALNTIFPTELPTGTPTILPTLDQNSKNQHNENDNISINDGMIAGIVVGGTVLFGICYMVYAAVNHIWPFVKSVASAENVYAEKIGAIADVNVGYELVVKHDDVEIAGAGSVNEVTL